MIIKSLVSLGCSLILIGCMSTHQSGLQEDTRMLFADHRFEKPTDFHRITDIYYLTEEQKLQLNDVIKPSNRHTLTQQLIDNLLEKDYQAFRYDNSYTRTASETLASKQGNCLSMVILSVAMAKHFGIKYKIYDIKTAPVWERNGGLFLINGHVNIKLQNSDKRRDKSVYEITQNYVTLDFIPRESRRSLSKEQISESALAAMYFSNLAADAMVQQQWNNAYWLLRESLSYSPRHGDAWNSLAVLYRYSQQEELAEKVYKHALAIRPQDTNVVANLAILLNAQGRFQELFEYQRQINLAEMRNPFRYYDKARYAYISQDYERAVRLYKKAIKLSPQVDQFYFGLYQSYLALDKDSLAIKNLKLAKERSSTIEERQRYNSKLAILTDYRL